MTSQITEDQHYVPRFYLKSFADSKQFLQILDVKNSHILAHRPYTGVCYEKYFYAQQTGVQDDVSQIIESWFQQIENYISSRLPTIFKSIRVGCTLLDDDIYVLSVLVAMLWLRGHYMRSQVVITEEEFEKQVSELTETKVNKDFTMDNSVHLRLIVESLGFVDKGFTNLCYRKQWQFYVSKAYNKFITSDSPVVEWFVNKGFFGTDFLSRYHYLSLAPDILVELRPPKGGKHTRRKIIFADKNDHIMMYNILIAQYSHNYAYSDNRQVFEDMIVGRQNHGAAEKAYIKSFVDPLR